MHICGFPNLIKLHLNKKSLGNLRSKIVCTLKSINIFQEKCVVFEKLLLLQCNSPLRNKETTIFAGKSLYCDLISKTSRFYIWNSFLKETLKKLENICFIREGKRLVPVRCRRVCFNFTWLVHGRNEVTSSQVLVAPPS